MASNIGKKAAIKVGAGRLRSSEFLILKRKLNRQDAKLEHILKILGDKHEETSQKETPAMSPLPNSIVGSSRSFRLQFVVDDSDTSSTSRVKTPPFEQTPQTSRISRRSSARTTPRPEHDQSQSRLLQLPSEIRNVIYEHVLVSTKPIENPASQREKNRNDNTKRIGDINSSLLMTCHMVLGEAKPILYGGNLFVFGVWKSAFWKEELRLATRVRLTIGTEVYSDRNEDITRQAKAWTDCLFTERGTQMPHELMPLLKELILDFTGWLLRKTDRFPPTLLKRIKGTPWKLTKLILLGLENHGGIRKDLEEALLEKPEPKLTFAELGRQEQAKNSTVNAATGTSPMLIDDINAYELEADTDVDSVAGPSSSTSPVSLAHRPTRSIQHSRSTSSNRTLASRIDDSEDEADTSESCSGPGSQSGSSKKRKASDTWDSFESSDSYNPSNTFSTPSKRIKSHDKDPDYMELDSEDDEPLERISTGKAPRKDPAGYLFPHIQKIIVGKKHTLSKKSKDISMDDVPVARKSSPPSTTNEDYAARITDLQPAVDAWK
ncbi:MAG: hypothetical protein MMC33_000839 [Icmadophila ericetorum]|nr:hypothetical protein [Icmadophila ericetorum]